MSAMNFVMHFSSAHNLLSFLADSADHPDNKKKMLIKMFIVPTDEQLDDRENGRDLIVIASDQM